MSCTVAYTCDHCGEQVVTEPLEGREDRVWLRYPAGWDFDSDGDAMCPACTDKNKAAA